MKGSEIFGFLTGAAFLLLGLFVAVELVTLFGNWLNAQPFMDGLF